MKKIPNPEELHKDISDYLSKKYGSPVIVTEPDKYDEPSGVKTKTSKGPDKINFQIKPMELEEYLNQFIVDQADAIEILATKVATHFNRMKASLEADEEDSIVGDIKSNILMIGPTGVGKTYIVKLIANRIGVPFVKGDATKFSETGYVGGDVEDLVRNLVHEADGDIKLAEYGIIYLDEIDKISGSKNSWGPDVSRTGVQRNLLKLMEEAEVDLKVPHDIASQMEAVIQAQKTGKVDRKKINTKNILFIVSGAFGELGDIIRKRLNKQPIGFKGDYSLSKKEENYFLKQVTTEDLINFGFESEFIGRLPVSAVLNDLDEHSLLKILQNENSSVIKKKERDFASYNISINFDNSALKEIAALASKEKTGARGLVNVVEKILIKFEKYLPSTHITQFTVTADVVNNPESILQTIKTQDSVSQFTKAFYSENDIQLHFTEEAQAYLADMQKERKLPYYHLCSELFKDYEYGLRLINFMKLDITKEVLENPKQYLDNLIKEHYEKRKEDSPD